MIIARKIIIHQKPQIAQINFCLSLSRAYRHRPICIGKTSSHILKLRSGSLLKRKSRKNVKQKKHQRDININFFASRICVFFLFRIRQSNSKLHYVISTLKVNTENNRKTRRGEIEQLRKSFSVQSQFAHKTEKKTPNST